MKASALEREVAQMMGLWLAGVDETGPSGERDESPAVATREVSATAGAATASESNGADEFLADPGDSYWFDPRPDLEDDHARWDAVLHRAYVEGPLDDGWRLNRVKGDRREWTIGSLRPEPGSVFGVLHGVRAMGARLSVQDTTLRLERGEIPEVEWTRDYHDEFGQPHVAWRKRYLWPHKDAIARILKETKEEGA